MNWRSRKLSRTPQQHRKKPLKMQILPESRISRKEIEKGEAQIRKEEIMQDAKMRKEKAKQDAKNRREKAIQDAEDAKFKKLKKRNEEFKQ